MKKIFSILLVAALVITGTIGATGMSVSAAGDTGERNTSYAYNLVLQLNKSDDPIKFWNGLTEEEQQIIAKSLVSDIKLETEIKETSLRDDEFKEITVTVNSYYYGENVWRYEHTVGWSYDHTSITAWYRYSEGYGWGYGFTYWVYIAEIDYYENYYGSSLACMSKGYWEVKILGQVVNTFDQSIATTHDKDGNSQ